jgi:hypothetical protein
MEWWLLTLLVVNTYTGLITMSATKVAMPIYIPIINEVVAIIGSYCQSLILIG